MSALPALVYVVDPMCSWCWGYAPVMAALRTRYAGQLEFNLLLGGLNPNPGRPLDAHALADLEQHWRHVHAATGQPFDHAFFARPQFVYDTGPASRAVVCARRLAAGREFDLLFAIQQAFYAANRDVTASEVLVDIAVEQGFDGELFAACFADHETWLATGNDFSIARSLQVRGFPALAIASEDYGLTVLGIGYQDLQSTAALIDEWLAAARQQARPT